jgi:flavin reductase (DIM6/NTAB) family NADH-FMN oxidoreductase RutF
MREVDPAHFRSVMGNFTTGVTVVTAAGPAGPVGMTANAVASLSLEPLLLLVAFDNTARTLQVVRDTGRFGVNVLAGGQEELARLFASKAPEDAKFAGIPHQVHDGIPVIDGVLAWVGCRLEQLVPGGDHTIGIGAVESAEAGERSGDERSARGSGRPLLWFRGEYR